jgi:hypothetical protein
MILGFIWWWPLGLVILGFLLARGRCWRRASYAGDGPMMGWNQGMDRWERKVARAQDRVERVRNRMERHFGPSGNWFGGGAASSSGNHAFDDYRAETLKRLEEEQHEFKDFLSRLRDAKDRAEFDQFMSARRPRPAEPNEPPQG